MSKKDFEISIKINAKIASVLLGVVAMIAAGGFFIVVKNYFMTNGNGAPSITLIEKASAAEIYPQFICTCCGKPLDKNNMCCGIAEDMIAYIDSKVNEDLSEDEVVLATVKKYGLKSLASESSKEEIKKQLAESAPADSPKISIEPLSHDFGDVSQAAGIVSKKFIIQNTGKTDLEINNLLSSCGCTTAAMVVNGEEGPRFGMHNNPKDWSTIIKPGETADIKVYYDPDTHADFRGQATREITVFSNDPVNFEKSIKIKLNQVD